MEKLYTRKPTFYTGKNQFKKKSAEKKKFSGKKIFPGKRPLPRNSNIPGNSPGSTFSQQKNFPRKIKGTKEKYPDPIKEPETFLKKKNEQKSGTNPREENERTLILEYPKHQHIREKGTFSKMLPQAIITLDKDNNIEFY